MSFPPCSASNEELVERVEDWVLDLIQEITTPGAHLLLPTSAAITTKETTNAQTKGRGRERILSSMQSLRNTGY